MFDTLTYYNGDFQVSDLEIELQEKIRALPNAPEIVYCNKGL